MFQIGELLGSGAHGHVFNIANNPEWVIKIGWAPVAAQFTSDTQLLQWTFERVDKIYKFLLNHQMPGLAKVSNFELLLKEEHKQYYAAIIEKLSPLTEDESKVFKSVCLEYNGNIAEGASLKHLQELEDWLIFNKNKVIEFYQSVNSLPIIHRDFHRRNIMKDGDGNFKLIDFELLIIKDKGSNESIQA